MRTLPWRLALLLPLFCVHTAWSQDSDDFENQPAAADRDRYFEPMYEGVPASPRYSTPSSQYGAGARHAAGESESTELRSSRLSSLSDQIAPRGARQYEITAKIVEFDDAGKEVVVGEPTLATIEGLKASVSLHGYKSVHLGGDVSITVPTVNISVPGGEGDEQLELGRSLHVKLTAREHGRIRLDARVQSRELEAVENGIRVRDHAVRAIETIRLGQSVTLVLDKDVRGAARSWIELTVRGGDESVARRRAPILPGPYDLPARAPATVRRAPVRRDLR